jgi:hypothetical protein
MNIVAEKNIIKKELDKVQDEHLIKAIREMLRYAHSLKTESVLKPFTKAQMIERAMKSEADIEAGRVTSLSKLKKEIKNW